jgi:hypothetical protein
MSITAVLLPFVTYLLILPCNISDYRASVMEQFSEERIGKDVEGGSHGLIQGTILASTLMDSGKLPKTSVRIATVLDKTQTSHLPKRSQKHYHISQHVQL